MLKFLSDFIRLEQLARLFIFSIFLLCIFIIWFLLQSLNTQSVETKDYKTLNASALEKFELYKRKLDDSPHLIISRNSKIHFAFDCDSLNASICDNEFIESGNKVTVDRANIVSIKGYKYIQLLQTQNSTHFKDIDYFVSHDQLALNYQQANKDMIFIFFIIFIIPFTSILIICYASIEEKIINKLSTFYT